MALSPKDSHSYARPEFASVFDTYLELSVDFDRKVLQGKAILTVERKSVTKAIILDNYGLIISSVRNALTGSNLNYQIGQCGIFGSKFTIQLPQIIKGCKNKLDRKLCKIEIEYETSPNSPALYWLRPEQTADGKHPFLLSNNKYTYARSVFPCQDTPSAKFTYFAMILAPPGFSVLMSASLVHNYVTENKWTYLFSQPKPIPSYALIIAVGVLQNTSVRGSRIGVCTEFKYIHVYDKICFLSLKSEEMLQIGEKLCGAYPWDSLNMCVLPPSVSHFEIECPCLIFVSPTLLYGDICLMSSIARTISQNWAGLSVTSANYKHLWLNKCFSTFIYRKILSALLVESVNLFSYARDLDDLRCMFEDFYYTGLLKCLLPNLVDMLPDESITYVPYEKGCILLLELENKIGGRFVFETFLKSYLAKFMYKSITTEEWKTYLRVYLLKNFPNILHKIENIYWDCWFNDPNYLPLEVFVKIELVLQEKCIFLAQRWINWNEFIETLPFESNDLKYFSDLHKIHFLNCLHASPTILSQKKMYFMTYIYQFNYEIEEIRFSWLRLCIKCRWAEIVPTALEFAIQFCSPKFTYPIFQDLYDWSDIRVLVVMKFLQEGWKMLDEIREGVAVILYLNEEGNVPNIDEQMLSYIEQNINNFHQK